MQLTLSHPDIRLAVVLSTADLIGWTFIMHIKRGSTRFGFKWIVTSYCNESSLTRTHEIFRNGLLILTLNIKKLIKFYMARCARPPV